MSSSELPPTTSTTTPNVNTDPWNASPRVLTDDSETTNKEKRSLSTIVVDNNEEEEGETENSNIEIEVLLPTTEPKSDHPNVELLEEYENKKDSNREEGKIEREDEEDEEERDIGCWARKDW